MDATHAGGGDAAAPSVRRGDPPATATAAPHEIPLYPSDDEYVYTYDVPFDPARKRLQIVEALSHRFDFDFARRIHSIASERDATIDKLNSISGLL